MQIQLCQCNHLRVSCSSVTHFIIVLYRKQAYLLCKKNTSQLDKTMELVGQARYFCSLARNANLNYACKLGTLLGYLDVRNCNQIQNQWVALYEIANYKPIVAGRYVVDSPCYGGGVLLRCGSGYKQKYISNCFKIDNNCYYFVDNQYLRNEETMLGEIISVDKKSIFGINIVIGNVNFCLSFSNIFQDYVGDLKICPSIKDMLEKTVYLDYYGSYSTGTLISNCKILTAKHLLSSTKPYIGTIINAKLYPYNTTQRAKLTQYPSEFIDLMELQIIYQSTQPNMQSEYFPYIQKNFQKLKISQDIQVMGFGKYNYQEHNFHRIALLLPTLSVGCISKVISMNDEETFFKINANLYNGFSGGAIWSNSKQIGTAIFIIKNPTTTNTYNNHSVSYSQKFIWHRFLERMRKQLSEEEIKSLKRFEAIQTRDRFIIRPKL